VIEADQLLGFVVMLNHYHHILEGVLKLNASTFVHGAKEVHHVALALD
jgi:hypothetical protein